MKTAATQRVGRGAAIRPAVNAAAIHRPRQYGQVTSSPIARRSPRPRGASLTSPDYPGGPPDGRGMVEAAGREWNFQHVSIGNPQCVIDAGDGLEELDLAVIGPQIATADLFPNRTNVSFIRVDGSTLRARIFERGVGETSASGTGASGAAVAASLRGASSPITVRLDGGELEVDVTDELDVRLTGTASRVYRGEISTDLAQGLAALT